MTSHSCTQIAFLIYLIGDINKFWGAENSDSFIWLAKTQCLLSFSCLAIWCIVGQFPGAEGLVASGMSAQFKVRFMPDSLGEYSDEIVVQSQCAEPLTVRVIAKRPPPVLTCMYII